MKKIIAIIIGTSLLQGCVFAVGAAAGAAGIAAVYDHRRLEQAMEDQKITNAIVNKIRASRNITDKNSHIDVTTFNGVVLLTGQTVSPAIRLQVGQFAQPVMGVKRVYNEMTIKAPTSSLTRTSDAWITTKIKTQLLAAEDLKSGSIKVATENGTVYLMGIVSHQQADEAANIARQVAGVQKVIKVFQYTNTLETN